MQVECVVCETVTDAENFELKKERGINFFYRFPCPVCETWREFKDVREV
jgi:uncharacterized protein YlaI